MCSICSYSWLFNEYKVENSSISFQTHGNLWHPSLLFVVLSAQVLFRYQDQMSNYELFYTLSVFSHLEFFLCSPTWSLLNIVWADMVESCTTALYKQSNRTFSEMFQNEPVKRNWKSQLWTEELNCQRQGSSTNVSILVIIVCKSKHYTRRRNDSL